MGNLQLFARPQYTGTTVPPYSRLDIMESEPIKITASVQSFEDPTRVSSVFSRTFKLPHTAANGPFFKAAFSINGTDFDITKKADSYILFNGVDFAQGYLRLNGITGNYEQGDVQYDVTFYGETADFGTKVGGGFLNELNLTALSHPLTYANIRNSWLPNGLMGGDIVYGLIEWGYAYNKDNQPTDSTLSHDYSKSFTNAANPYWLEQFKPSIRAKRIWDQIFNDAGFTYESSFLGTNLSYLQTTYPGSNRFKNLYTTTEVESRSILPTAALFQGSSSTNIYGDSDPVQETRAPINVEAYDYQNAFDNSVDHYYYTAQTTAVHKFKCRARAYIGHNEAMESTLYYLIVRIVDVTSGNALATYSTSDVETGGVQLWVNENYTEEKTVNLTQGQKVCMTVEVDFNTPDHPTTISQMGFMCTQAGVNFNVATLLPAKIKKIEFIKSIITKFKLVFVPSKTIRNHFVITPWADWIKQGSVVDWSSKIDHSKDISIKPLFDKMTRKVTFTEKDDTDYINDFYQQSNDKRVFGNMILDSTNEMLTGETTYTTEFSPIQIGPIGYKDADTTLSPKFLVPHIAKDTGGGESSPGKREPIVPKMKLAYYNGKVSAPRTWYMAPSSNGTGTAAAQTEYPLFSNYETWPVTATTLDINWKNEKPAWYDTIPEASKPTYPWLTNQSTYEVFWKDWYTMMFDPYSRMVDCTVVLSYKDFLNLKFNDKIFIRDAWYFVDSISDFVVGETSSCKAKLVKIGNSMNIAMSPTSPFHGVLLCRGTSACAAYCCCKNVECDSLALFYTDGTTLATSQYIFADQYGGVFAPAGYYASSNAACYLGPDGVIDSFYNVGSCDCGGGGASESFAVRQGQTPCESKISGNPLTVYGEQASFVDNTKLFLDTDRTIEAVAGAYREDTDPDYSITVGDYGLRYSTDIVTDCPGTFYYRFVVKYNDTTDCAACCTLSTVTVYSDQRVWTDATDLWLSNDGTDAAPTGFYSFEGDVAEVTDGAVGAWTLCSSCAPCPDGTVSVTVCVYQDIDGYKTIGSLYTSKDNVVWDLVGSVSTVLSNPSMTPSCQEFLVNAGLYASVVFGTDEPDGLLTMTLSQNGVDDPSVQIATPGSYDYSFPTTLVDGIDYIMSGIVLDGTVVVPTYTEMSLWYEKNTDSPCIPFCHIDMVADTVFGDGLTLATSTYLYVSGPSGYEVAPSGWYSNGVAIREVGDHGLIIADYDGTLCDCNSIQTRYYPFVVTFDGTSYCDVCCSGAPSTIYGVNPVWSDNKIFYKYTLGIIGPATDGWYAMTKNNWIQLDVDGVVIDSGLCNDGICSCTPSYYTFYIFNRTTSTVKYSYTDWESNFYSGEIEPDKYIITECMDLSTLSTSGYCEAQVIDECLLP